jgi:GDP/UDP-N,N'-diacetylbacillosamine 2-epimerase (hydrolysing)
MISKRKICAVTGSRAEYGLLSPLLKLLTECDAFSLAIVATGMHMSPEFGLTYRDIEDDGFTVTRKVEMLLSADSPGAIAKSMGLAMITFGDVWQDLQPDLIVVLGDRFEIFAAVSAALPFNIPVAHLHGGELTEGAIDDTFRHCISKMAHLHFTSTAEFRTRVIQLGEQPERVFCVGAIGLDAIRQIKPQTRGEFEKSIGFELGKHNLLITFHPVTREADSAAQQFAELLTALDELQDTHLIFTGSNADTYGRRIIEMMVEYVAHNGHKAVFFTSLGRTRYLSALRHVDGVVGNSSSGVIEAPGCGAGTVNIGERQTGRVMAQSVIQCAPRKQSIRRALDLLLSDDFKKTAEFAKNPYGDGHTADRILEILKACDLQSLVKKHFYTVAGDGDE